MRLNQVAGSSVVNFVLPDGEVLAADDGRIRGVFHRSALPDGVDDTREKGLVLAAHERGFAPMTVGGMGVVVYAVDGDADLRAVRVRCVAPNVSSDLNENSSLPYGTRLRINLAEKVRQMFKKRDFR